MIVLGIDPGLAIVGYSIVEMVGNKMKLHEYGCITTSSKSPLPLRLEVIYSKLNDIIKEYRPLELAIEELFFNQNVKTAITVAQARGVEVLTAKINGLDIFEYTPLQIKQAITGYGHADKGQIQYMVKLLMGLDKVPKPDDAADAIAVAICHLQSQKFKDGFRMK